MQIWVHIGSEMMLPEPALTCHKWCSAVFTWEFIQVEWQANSNVIQSFMPDKGGRPFQSPRLPGKTSHRRHFCYQCLVSTGGVTDVEVRILCVTKGHTGHVQYHCPISDPALSMEWSLMTIGRSQFSKRNSSNKFCKRWVENRKSISLLVPYQKQNTSYSKRKACKNLGGSSCKCQLCWHSFTFTTIRRIQCPLLWPLLLTWFTFKPSMDKYPYAQ